MSGHTPVIRLTFNYAYPAVYGGHFKHWGFQRGVVQLSRLVKGGVPRPRSKVKLIYAVIFDGNAYDGKDLDRR